MENTVEQRLQLLADLQRIDTQLDRLRQIRGGLPEEVQDLEDELEGLRTRLERLHEEIDNAKSEIRNRENVIAESKELIKKYERQLNEVKNNREFEALNKEIELANLEILTSERKIKIFHEFIEEKQAKMDEVQATFDERKNDLDAKNKELEVIIIETRAEEQKLMEDSKKASEKLEKRLQRAYSRIRGNMRNGLAVVTMDRGACGGCFAIIPPQRQAEIRQSKKLIVCENCGRILVDKSYFGVEEPVLVEDEKASVRRKTTRRVAAKSETEAAE
ncbi:MAG: C4-type zinc ribbon domain-containing protein [Bacteroidetes bacterium]|jgi:predicted  nucleic acid-binding Zn-ribbon protein|nr:C4-type zinc ribbon domain-containing protein [Bacteroidota bacterium]